MSQLECLHVKLLIFSLVQSEKKAEAQFFLHRLQIDTQMERGGGNNLDS